MRVSHLTSLVVVVAALVTLAAPALAKGVIEVTVQADDGTVKTLTGDGAALDLAVSSHVHDAAFGTDPSIAMTDPPSGDLGPRFSLQWDLGFEVPLRQVAYPLAKDGPVTYVPSGQRLNGDPDSSINRTSGGWFQADAELITAIESIGFSPRADDEAFGPLDRGIFLAMAAIISVLVGAATILIRARQRPLPV